MRLVEIYQADVFTAVPFLGNPAGVVLDARGLRAAEMQAIARELNNSETAFVLPAPGPELPVGIRYFTPTTEVPLCGHATVAAHYVRAVALDLGTCTVVQRSAAGEHQIQIDRSPAGVIKVTMTQDRPTFSRPLPAAVASQIMRALGISQPDRLDLPVEIVSTGHSKVMIGLRSRSRLAELAPDLPGLAAISRTLRCNGYFVFSLEEPDEGTQSTARMFAPAIGISEDPVTGNGNGPLGAFCVRHALLPWAGNELDFHAAQGHAVGRRGVVRVRVDIDENGSPDRVRIGEDAVLVFHAQMCF
jgi:PhzF family phenazine biosynthesis protein